MTVRRVCMDCGSDMGEAPGYAPGETGVSHGLCDGCDAVREQAATSGGEG